TSAYFANKIIRMFGWRPLFSIDLSEATGVVAFTILPFIPVFIYDFFYYWFHRLQHTVSFLWRFHRVHHSIRELNAFNNYHHLSEELLRLPLVIAPMSLLAQITLPQVAIVAFMVNIAGQFTHSNTRISYGLLRFLFCEPRYHRIHHSIEPKHFDKN